MESSLGGVDYRFGVNLLKSEIRKAAKFCLKSYNRKQNTSLELVGVEKAAVQDAGLIVYLMLKVNDNGDHKIFKTAVCKLPQAQLVGAIDLEYVSQAVFSTVSPPQSEYHPKGLYEIKALAEFSVEMHNAKKLEQLGLVDIVEIYGFQREVDYIRYSLSILLKNPNAEDKCFLYKTKVTKGQSDGNFMETTPLKCICKVSPPSHVIPEDWVTPELIYKIEQLRAQMIEKVLGEKHS